MRQVARDPFDRSTLTKRSVTVAKGYGCAWCGNEGRILKNGKQRLYIYSVQKDGVNTKPVDVANGRVFCSVDCMRIFTK